MIPFFLSLSAFISFIPLIHSPHDSQLPAVGAEVRGRAEISGLFAHVTYSGKQLEDGRPVFAEIDPGTPRLSCLSGSGKKLPEITIDDKDIDGEGTMKKGYGEGEEMPRSGQSWKTFGVGEAV